ncbi:MAG: putative nucleotidyltransferase substrate binding domain-containing protein [Hyphomicrobium sp.]
MSTQQLSTQDTKSFLRRVAPFDRLRDDDLDRLVEEVTQADFAPDEEILKRWENPAFLYVIVRGIVNEIGPMGLIARHSSGESFDSRGLIEGRSQHRFVCQNVCTCYLVPALQLRALSKSNAVIREYYTEDMARQADALIHLQQQREAASFLMARIGEGVLHPAIFVPPQTTIGEAAMTMKERATSALLVRRHEEVGIFTGRDIREKFVLRGMPDTNAIGDLASYDLITIDQDDLVFDALIAMTKHSIRHLVVTSNQQIVGMLEQADLLNYLTNSSYAIASKAERAKDQDDLQEAAADIPRLVTSLHERGMKPRFIARLVTDLNSKIMRRLFMQMAPPALAAEACLIVMGSEGRGEQLLRTDQDNGIIFRDERPPPAEFQQVAQAFPQSLIKLGYPPCTGNVMTSNPEWAKPLSAFREDMFRWVHQPSPEGFMALAIFFDARAVAGDENLLLLLKNYLTQLIHSQQTIVRHFARVILAFPTPLGLFNRFVLGKETHAGALDIKKGGIFPVVHGVRTLALEHGLTETNTIGRLQILSGQPPLGREFTADLIEAFDFMSMLRLRAQLKQLEEGAATSNSVRPSRLNRLDRSLLRNSLGVVKEFKSLVTLHFHLDSLS